MSESFSFNSENQIKVKEIIAKYPAGRQKSAMLPLLDLAQRQNGGWLSVASMEHVAEVISEPYMRVYEVATFYTMYNLKPVGKYHIQVCGTTPCWLRGAHDVIKTCETFTGAKCGSTSEDKMFTLSEVECLGACRNAPMMQINDDFYEDLDDAKIKEIINTLKIKQ
ncbi:MAG: NADH-quinone oxidoreductase subunit NuoE [Rickettsiales bacterium]|nr:MAG: NADH-quinone oxidoreductase subunit NuoE [Rickettsiales bacterium]